MAYKNLGGYPAERASKLGHMWLVGDPNTRALLQTLESTSPTHDEIPQPQISHCNISKPGDIQTVISIDGGECPRENPVYPERRLFFLSLCGMKLNLNDLEWMQRAPLLDPRMLSRHFARDLWQSGGVIPLSGIRIPGQSVQETIRATVDRILDYTGLYPALIFLVSREWDPHYRMEVRGAPHFECRRCGEFLYVPKSSIDFSCPACGHPHRLSDYLRVDAESGEEWVRSAAGQALRNVLEILLLIHLIRELWQKPEILRRTLFIRDGPLMLRAGLYRLVDDIRAFFRFLVDQGIDLHVVGIEKTGDIADYAEVLRHHLPGTGDLFLPPLQFIAENIHGYRYNPRTHRSRALFGAKVYARIGPHHVLALNCPVRDYDRDASPEDLFGFQDSLAALTRLVSYQYKNALIPVVLANQLASISQNFSGNALETFASTLISTSTKKDTDDDEL